jgi:hypothetical protein
MSMNIKLLGIFLAASVALGIFGKGQIETLIFKPGTKEAIGGDQLTGGKANGDIVSGGDKTGNIGGDKVGDDKVGGGKAGNANGDSIAGNKTGDVKGDNTGGNKTGDVGGSIVNGSQTIVNAQPGSTIAINPGDPKYDNKQLPNVSEKLSESQPANLSSFKTALPFTQDMLLNDYGRFTYPSSDKVLIQDRPFFSRFKLTGDNAERKTGFNLSGKQKAIFLQFGLPDLQQRRGDTLIYDVSVVASSQTSRKTVWSGKVIYGSKDQIISLPFEAADATTLIIKYTIVQGSDERPLHITRAESLYD